MTEVTMHHPPDFIFYRLKDQRSTSMTVVKGDLLMSQSPRSQA